MKTWSEMTDQEKTKALAEKLGWVREDFNFWPGWRLPDGRWFEAQAHSLTESWEDMSLVVEAMQERGWHREVKHYQSGLISALFDGKDGTFCGEAWDHNEPAATAEAAYKALGEGE
mgnify:CR=1 FL=1